MENNYPQIKLTSVLKKLNTGLTKDTIYWCLKQIFPHIIVEDLSAIKNFRIAICLPREQTYLGKFLTFEKNKNLNSKNKEFDYSDFVNFFQNFLNVVEDLKEKWPIENLFVIADEKTPMSFDWNLAKDFTNYHLWATDDDIKGNIPNLKEQILDHDFSLHVYPVVCSPENQNEIWQVGPELELPKNYAKLSFDEKQKSWDELFNKNKDDLKSYFKIREGSLYNIEPSIQLRWNVSSPDNKNISNNLQETRKSWKTLKAAKLWLMQKENLIKETLNEIIDYITIDLINKELQTNFSYVNNIFQKKYTELDKNNIPFIQNIEKKMTDFFSDDYMKLYSSAHVKQIIENVYKNSDLVTWLYENPTVHIPLCRQFVSTFLEKYQKISLVDPKELINLSNFYIEKEHSFVEKWFSENRKDIFNKNKMLSKIKKDEKYQQKILELLVWNDLQDVLKEEKEKLIAYPEYEKDIFSDKETNFINQSSETDTSSSSLFKILIGQKPALYITAPSSFIIMEKMEKKEENLEGYKTSMVWKELLTKFDIKVKIKNQEVHPFARWMLRLSPPLDIQENTFEWLVDNQIFNKINRSILQKKDGDEIHLNIQLNTKLQNVLDVAQKIIIENSKNGGWFGRLKKNFQNGITDEEWANVFFDFQKYILSMIQNINEQLDRDKMWLKHADQLVNKASQVDLLWSNWLKTMASQLSNEREKNTNPKPEEKLIWNKNIEKLDSASLAHEHIKTGNAVTLILLEKVKQSIEVKQKLQERTMMFYWSSLNMFAGLQSLQRNSEGLFEQAEFNQMMSQSITQLSQKTLSNEIEEKQKIKESFKKMMESQESLEAFYKNISDFQQETLSIFGELNVVRKDLQEDTLSVPSEKTNSRKSLQLK